MLWLGVDIGTTHVKVLVLRDGAGVVAHAVEATPVDVRGNAVSRRPGEVADAVVRLVRRAMASVAGDREVGGLAVASVGEEIVPVDRHGSPLGDVPVWYDRRGLAEAGAFGSTGLHRQFPPDPTYSLFKLLWLAAHRRAVVERAARFLDLSSFVLTRFGAPPVMDWSHASRTALFDPVSVAWDPETVRVAGLRAATLPDLVPSGTVVGRLDPAVAGALDLAPGVPLVAGGHDHFVGAFASGVRSSGDHYLSAGTSEAQLVLGDGPLAPTGGPARIDQGRFVDDHHWYAHKAAPCGQLYGQWRDLLYRDDPDAVEAELRSAPALAGVQLELDVDGRTASLLHVPLTATRGVLMRAVEEGSAMATRRVFLTLERASGLTLRRIIASGHATADERWRSLRMGLLGRDLDVVAEPEVTALGAALLARKGITGEPGPSAAVSTHHLGPADVALAQELLARFQPDGVAGSPQQEPEG